MAWIFGHSKTEEILYKQEEILHKHEQYIIDILHKQEHIIDINENELQNISSKYNQYKKKWEELNYQHLQMTFSQDKLKKEVHLLKIKIESMEQKVDSIYQHSLQQMLESQIIKQN